MTRRANAMTADSNADSTCLRPVPVDPPTDGTFAKRQDRIPHEAWAVAAARGLRIARRTIAKYRAELGIPPVAVRRRRGGGRRH